MQLETAAEAKAKRGPKATIQRKLMRIRSPALPTGYSPHSGLAPKSRPIPASSPSFLVL